MNKTRRILILAIVWLCLILLDQLIKVWLSKSHSSWIYKNPGLIFGIFSSQLELILVLIFTGLLVFFFLVSMTRERKGPTFGLAVTLILAGGFSNLLDRLWHGWVIDYIALWWLPVFNLADVMIILGCGILIWRSLSNPAQPLK